MTNFQVETSAGVIPEKRDWLLHSHGINRNITLDADLFTDLADEDGLVWSGCALGVVTATNLYGPYDNSATDGRETARGLLFNTFAVKAGAKVGTAMAVHEFIRPDRLPYATGPGALDAAARVDLPHLMVI